MLPGSTHNRRFLDLMLGVRDALPPRLEQQLAKSTEKQAGTFLSLVALGRLVTKLIWNWLTLRPRIKQFYRRLETALHLTVEELKGLSLDELAKYYRSVEQVLLNRWDAPVLNDFYCMIFFGLSRQALRQWGGPEAESLHGEFLQRNEGIVSTEPAKRIVAMAAIAAEDERLLTSLRSGGPQEWKPAIEANVRFHAAYTAYLERFGDRCLEELKLESITTKDDPTSLLQAIVYRSGQPPVETPTWRVVPQQALRRLMPGKPIRRAICRWLIGEATRRVRSRENLRFERTRVFGHARQILLQMGQRFADAALLADRRDIFFLEIEEVLGAIEGLVTTANLSEIVRVRQAENERFRELPEPPTRFETRAPSSRHYVRSTVPRRPTISGWMARSVLDWDAALVSFEVPPGSSWILVAPPSALVTS